MARGSGTARCGLHPWDARRPFQRWRPQRSGARRALHKNANDAGARQTTSWTSICLPQAFRLGSVVSRPPFVGRSGDGLRVGHHEAVARATRSRGFARPRGGTRVMVLAESVDANPFQRRSIESSARSLRSRQRSAQTSGGLECRHEYFPVPGHHPAPHPATPSRETLPFEGARNPGSTAFAGPSPAPSSASAYRPGKQSLTREKQRNALSQKNSCLPKGGVRTWKVGTW